MPKKQKKTKTSPAPEIHTGLTLDDVDNISLARNRAESMLALAKHALGELPEQKEPDFDVAVLEALDVVSDQLAYIRKTIDAARLQTGGAR